MRRSALALCLVFVCLHVPVFADSSILTTLQQADSLAWLTDWYSALPLYERAEKEALRVGDRRNAMYAKFGRLRGQMQTLPLATLSEQLGTDLHNPIAIGDPRLRLRGLTVKGDVDLDWDVQAAQRDWEQVAQIARELGDKGWQNRATGELAMVAFLKGDTGKATAMIQQALQATAASGDIGGQVRYMGAIANGLWLAGNPQLALAYADRALALAKAHPETGFPFVVYSTRALALVALNQPDEAERFANAAMSEAQAGDRRIKQVELLMVLGQIAHRRNQTDRVIELYSKAAAGARSGHVQRLLADAEANLADAYRTRGDLAQARKHALAAIADTEANGSRFTLPIRVAGLADIYAAEGNVAAADRRYEQATDIVEGIMVTVPSRDAQARLIGVMSDIYTGHFRLVADRLKDPAKAYAIVERARGRALADVLRTVPDGDSATAGEPTLQMRTISRLQVRLMRAGGASERKQLLDELWAAEQNLAERAERPRPSTNALRPMSVRLVQQALQPRELLVEYVLAEPHSYALVVTRRGLDVVSLASRRDIEQRVDQFNADLRARRPVNAPASSLRDLVLAPIADWLRGADRIVVVPDGKLHMLAFDVLASDASNAQVVTTAPSANVFALLRTRAEPNTESRRALLAVGGVPYDQMFSARPVAVRASRGDEERGLYDASFPSALPVLASAEEEVLNAARALGPSSVTLTGERAKESALKRLDLRQFGIVHFAVHAIADTKFPERAALVLLNDPEGGDDGLLQPREIARLRMNQSVVVLSACDTSVGPTIGQEGVQNLARAFLLAGAQAVVTTLWSVSDAISSSLMKSFYDNLASGRDVAGALMDAKRTVLKRFGPDALPTTSAFQVVGLGDHRFGNSPSRSATARELTN